MPKFSLRHLIISENKIEDVPWPTTADLSRGPSLLRTISLASNRIRSWSSLDALAAWFPYLEGFYGQDNPYLEGWSRARPHSDYLNVGFDFVEAQPGTLECARPLTIARFPSLITCDGSPVSRIAPQLCSATPLIGEGRRIQITPYERKDAELFYLTFIVKTVPNPDERTSIHPQWSVLCASEF